MTPLKLYYLSAEVAPFSETYELATFSRKITSKLHDKVDIDIRVSQPKYGYVSERKYILREVIRLKDIPVMFNEKKHIINMKSCFIPETRVQVYFIENNPLYKSLPDLIYKARNGRIFSDIDERFTFFALSAIDTLTSLFWAPDVFICNDWQTSFLRHLHSKYGCRPVGLCSRTCAKTACSQEQLSTKHGPSRKIPDLAAGLVQSQQIGHLRPGLERQPDDWPYSR